MAVYVVHCHLKDPARNAETIDATLRTAEQCLRPFPLTWIVQGATTAKMLRNVLVEHLGPDDGLLITVAGNDAGWENVSRDVAEWLADRFTTQASTDPSPS